MKQVWRPVLRPSMELTTKKSTQMIPSIVQTKTHANEGIITVNPCVTTHVHHYPTPTLTHYHQSIQEWARLLQIKLFGPRSLVGGITAPCTL